MSNGADAGGGSDVLRSKRNATRYRILVGIAERQPAVSQQEIADAVGVTAQAVSDYLQDLADQGYVEKHGRGRYEVTKEGVDWLISQTDSLREFVDHVSEDVVGEVEVETAVAATRISGGQTVSLEMRDGVLHARADRGAEGPDRGDEGLDRGDGGGSGATAVAIADADAGEDVGVTNFDGVVDYEVGTVTVLAVPEIRDRGSSAVDPGLTSALADENDLVATAGTEALVTARTADVDPDVRFGTASAVHEAATRGLDVLLVATRTELASHTAALRDGNVGYEVVDAGEE